MDNITINNFVVRVDVETVHGNYTEFVLDRASWRTDTDYYHALHVMVDKELGLLGTVREVDCYYKPNISVNVHNYDDIQKVISVCNNTVGKWINRYNVNRMLPYKAN